ncbi:M50 family metallopeptidase [Pseudoclavibacter chungangensis]|uniref:M50 family metallopeptidase n=1 Tax=Pseudoclavibacter chungangensis TaxID=587635 RepID=A0A7J5C250_9MICO|nr:M50 family metallopeptidase [Pseudoclavibacter chungangensis]KAB1660160.1 M50 family metallopeptidase [Pseudoclavibacter chungangensis]NYJ66728.1 hypothetical protein [Pseudoclavibacter chungangensis]
MDVLDLLLSRLAPASDVAIPPLALFGALAVGALLVLVGPVWKVVRLCVTLVHELGHAIVGVLVGRRFTGFVVRGDMSGHAVTSGKPTGFGRALSVWAGYPAPAILGAALAFAASRGWAAPVVFGVGVVLLLVLVRVRSLLTGVVVVVALASTAALWWWRDDTVQTTVLIALAVVLVVGAWRHLAAVRADRGSGSDPAVLAKLTRVPKGFWNTSFALVCLVATVVVVLVLWPDGSSVLDLVPFAS